MINSPASHINLNQVKEH